MSLKSPNYSIVYNCSDLNLHILACHPILLLFYKNHFYWLYWLLY